MRVRRLEILHHFSQPSMKNFYNVLKGYESENSKTTGSAKSRSNEKALEVVVKNSGSEISVVKNYLHTL